MWLDLFNNSRVTLLHLRLSPVMTSASLYGSIRRLLETPPLIETRRLLQTRRLLIKTLTNTSAFVEDPSFYATLRACSLAGPARAAGFFKGNLACLLENYHPLLPSAIRQWLLVSRNSLGGTAFAL